MKKYTILILVILFGCKEKPKEGWTNDKMSIYTSKIYGQLLELNPQHDKKYVHIVADKITEVIFTECTFQSLDTLPNWYITEKVKPNSYYGWGKQDDISIEYLKVEGVDFSTNP